MNKEEINYVISEPSPHKFEKSSGLGCSKCYLMEQADCHSPATDELKENLEEDIKLQNILHEFNREMNYSDNAPLPPLEHRAVKQKYAEQIKELFIKSQIKKAEERSKRAERERILAMVEKIIVGRGQYVSKLRELKALLTEK